MLFQFYFSTNGFYNIGVTTKPLQIYKGLFRKRALVLVVKSIIP